MTVDLEERLRTLLDDATTLYGTELELAPRRRRRGGPVLIAVAVAAATIAALLAVRGGGESVTIRPAHEGKPQYAPGVVERLPPNLRGDVSQPTLVWTGKEVLSLGGTYFVGGVPAMRPDAEAYDPATKTWRRLPDPPVPLTIGSPAAWTGSEAVVLTPKGAEAFDPATSKWRVLNADGRLEARMWWTGSEMLVLDPLGNGTTFDPRTDAVPHRLPPFPETFRPGPVAAFGRDVYVIGGTFYDAPCVSMHAWHLSLETERWERLPDVPQASSFAAHIAVLNGRLHVLGTEVPKVREGPLPANQPRCVSGTTPQKEQILDLREQRWKAVDIPTSVAASSVFSRLWTTTDGRLVVPSTFDGFSVSRGDGWTKSNALTGSIFFDTEVMAGNRLFQIGVVNRVVDFDREAPVPDCNVAIAPTEDGARLVAELVANAPFSYSRVACAAPGLKPRPSSCLWNCDFRDVMDGELLSLEQVAFHQWRAFVEFRSRDQKTGKRATRHVAYTIGPVNDHGTTTLKVIAAEVVA